MVFSAKGFGEFDMIRKQRIGFFLFGCMSSGVWVTLDANCQPTLTNVNVCASKMCKQNDTKYDIMLKQHDTAKLVARLQRWQHERSGKKNGAALTRMRRDWGRPVALFGKNTIVCCVGVCVGESCSWIYFLQWCIYLWFICIAHEHKCGIFCMSWVYLRYTHERAV